MPGVRAGLRALVPGEAIGTFRRFPLPVACALGATALTVATDSAVPFAIGDRTDQIIALLLLALIATVAAKLWGESWRRPWPHHIGLAAALVALLALRVFTVPIGNSLAALMLAPAAVLGASTLAFVGRRGIDGAFWAFNRGAWFGALFGLVVALALGGGVSLAFGALDVLLGVDVDGDLFQHVWTIALCLVWPLVALGNGPRIGDAADAEPGRLGTVLVGYVLVPLVGAYLLILYAYIARIALAWSLPDGEIAPVVGACAGIGVATHYLAFPQRQTGTRPVRLFHRHGLRALLPPLLLLAVAIGVRIDAYGVTEARYVAALGALWLIALAAHGSLAPDRRLVLMPAVLGALLALGSFGPWGAIAVATTSQRAVLERLLVEGGILSDAGIAPIGQPLEAELQRRLASVVGYLHDTGKRATLAAVVGAAAPSGDEPPIEAWFAALGIEALGPSSAMNTVDFFAGSPYALATVGYDAAITFDITLPLPARTLAIAMPAGQRAVTLTSRGDDLVATVGVRELIFDLGAIAPGIGARPPIVIDAVAGDLRGRLVIERLYARRVGETLADVYGRGTLLLGGGL